MDALEYLEFQTPAFESWVRQYLTTVCVVDAREKLIAKLRIVALESFTNGKVYATLEKANESNSKRD